MEWNNLADDEKYADVLEEMRKKLPKKNAEFLPKIPRPKGDIPPMQQETDFLD